MSPQGIPKSMVQAVSLDSLRRDGPMQWAGTDWRLTINADRA